LSASHSYLFLHISLFLACCLSTFPLQSTCLSTFSFASHSYLYLYLSFCFQSVSIHLPLTVHLLVYLFVCKSQLFLSIPVPLFSACCLSACILPSTSLSIFSFASHRYLYLHLSFCLQSVHLHLTVHLPVYLFVCKPQLYLTVPVPLCFQPVFCLSASFCPPASLSFRLHATDTVYLPVPVPIFFPPFDCPLPLTGYLSACLSTFLSASHSYLYLYLFLCFPPVVCPLVH
jgi:hypothetical protein